PPSVPEQPASKAAVPAMPVRMKALRSVTVPNYACAIHMDPSLYPCPMHTPATASTTQGARSGTWPMVVLTSLFFMWGFMTVMNDVLVPHLKKVFTLTYAESML